MLQKLGVVIIGRNEGTRLHRCILSIKRQLTNPDSVVVYVDSGSSDNSCQFAEETGVHVINLDLSTPFTAARARNTGFFYLRENYPDIHYIQFIDGDCELIEGWFNKAQTHLERKPELAIVCGRRSEKHPTISVYNKLIDLEWNTPIGEAQYCGGDALVRVEAINQVNGYKNGLICGEEPEMCIRLRKMNWKIERIDEQMTLHDAAIFNFSQWWKRAIRGGWAISEGYWIHGNTQEQYMKKEHLSGWLWGLFLPLVCVSLLPLTEGLSLCLLLGYLALTLKVILNQIKKGHSLNTAYLYAIYCVLSKFPQMIGQAKFYWHMIQVKQATIIEYK